jgi:hypothetical protein
MVVCACQPSYTGSKNKRTMVQSVIQASLGKNMRLYLKINKAKRAGGVVQVVECLPSKHEALSHPSSC